MCDSPHILVSVQDLAVTITYLLTTFKKSAENVFLWPAGMHYIRHYTCKFYKLGKPPQSDHQQKIPQAAHNFHISMLCSSGMLFNCGTTHKRNLALS
jgi:hypothetical protein